MYIFNKKAFRSNANRPLADSPGDVVKQVWTCPEGGVLYSEVHVEQVWSFLGGGARGESLYGEGVIWSHGTSLRTKRNEWKHYLSATLLADGK